jgi:hypothetical protein
MSDEKRTDPEIGVRHIGPMAQDFAAAFGFGDTDRKISFIDANGVATVAIQALYRRVIGSRPVSTGSRRQGPRQTEIPCRVMRRP